MHVRVLGNPSCLAPSLAFSGLQLPPLHDPSPHFRRSAELFSPNIAPLRQEHPPVKATRLRCLLLKLLSGGPNIAPGS
jgi:hypothetical protein